MQRYAISDGRYSAAIQQTASPEPPATQVSSNFNDSPPEPPSPPLPLRAALLNQARSLAVANVDFFQLREKHLNGKHLVALTRDLLAVLKGSPTRLLVSARADVAVATGAHGVHLPAAPGELTPSQVRTVYAAAALPAPIVSQACHSLEAIRAAQLDPPSLILFSPVFGKPLVTGDSLPGTGLDALQAACALAHPIPVFALGGITRRNAPACIAAGARGIAGIRLFQPGAHTG